MFEAEKKAFREGKDIQVFHEDVGYWRLSPEPTWSEHWQYRVKSNQKSKDFKKEKLR